jgi:mRNA interferase RelE/StbE
VPRYEVGILPSAAKAIAKLPLKARVRIVAAIDALAENPRPHGVKKLKGEADLYRVRVGEFRIIYQIEDRRLIVTVVRVGDRKEVYD